MITENPCNVIYTDSYEQWLDSLSENMQDDAYAAADLLARYGVNLAFPYSSKVEGSKLRALRELRFVSQRRKIRVLYVFDPFRQAILLFGGDKTNDKNWYIKSIPAAEKSYRQYLERKGK